MQNKHQERKKTRYNDDAFRKRSRDFPYSTKVKSFTSLLIPIVKIYIFFPAFSYRVLMSKINMLALYTL